MPLKHIEGVEWWQVLVYEDPKPDLLGNMPHDTVEVPDDMLARWAGAFRAFCEMQREMAKVLTGEALLPFNVDAGPGGAGGGGG